MMSQNSLDTIMFDRMDFNVIQSGVKGFIELAMITEGREIWRPGLVTIVLGIDTGGTFTDFVLVDQAAARIATAKVSSTPGDPSIAIAAGLALLDGADRIEHVVIGTTVATNAVIERVGPRMIFITNRGFEDVPFVGRLDKEKI